MKVILKFHAWALNPIYSQIYPQAYTSVASYILYSMYYACKFIGSVSSAAYTVDYDSAN